MNNMYDILGKMKLLEGKGSKPDFLDLDKDGDKTEPMKQAAADKKLASDKKFFDKIGKSAKKMRDIEDLKLAKGEYKEEVDETSYSAKSARAGKDIGKPGKQFAKIAKSAGERYGSKERGEKVAGAVLAKLRAKEDVETEGNAFTAKLKSTPKGGTFRMGGKTYRDTSDIDESQLDELDISLIKAAQKHSKAHPTHKDPESERNIGKKYGYRTDRDDSEDDDYDEWGNEKPKKKSKSRDEGPKRRGRPKGTGRKLGAKGPTGKSKLLKKGAVKEDGIDDEDIAVVDKGEYDREGEMAKQQMHTIMRAAKNLHNMLGDDDNLPEWVQKKITLAQNYIDSVSDYMTSQRAEAGEEPIAEKAVSKQQQKFMGMVHAMQKGEKIPGASKELKKVARTMEPKDVEDFAKTKHAGLPKKVKKEEEVEETTVAGSVAVAPAGGKGKKGMIFGKGVYEGKIEESFSTKLTQILNEGMSINASVGEDGQKNLTVTASDEDAEQLAAILKMAGVGSQGGYDHACPACGKQECGCEQMDEATNELANSPEEETETTDYMTNTIAGGLNKKKVTGMTTIPVVPTQKVTNEEIELERNLFNLYKQFKA